MLTVARPPLLDLAMSFLSADQITPVLPHVENKRQALWLNYSCFWDRNGYLWQIKKKWYDVWSHEWDRAHLLLSVTHGSGKLMWATGIHSRVKSIIWYNIWGPNVRHICENKESSYSFNIGMCTNLFIYKGLKRVIQVVLQCILWCY